MLLFEWDENKNIQNIKKHHVSFQDAKSSFYDNYSLLLNDPDHSQDEERFILLGLSSQSNLLVVCHCYRYQINGDETIRIISARKATKNESKVYFERKRI